MECVPLEGKKVKALVSHIAWLIFGVHLSAMQHMTELGKYFRRTANSPKKARMTGVGNYSSGHMTVIPRQTCLT